MQLAAGCAAPPAGSWAPSWAPPPQGAQSRGGWGGASLGHHRAVAIAAHPCNHPSLVTQLVCTACLQRPLPGEWRPDADARPCALGGSPAGRGGFPRMHIATCATMSRKRPANAGKWASLPAVALASTDGRRLFGGGRIVTRLVPRSVQLHTQGWHLPCRDSCRRTCMPASTGWWWLPSSNQWPSVAVRHPLHHCTHSLESFR